MEDEINKFLNNLNEKDKMKISISFYFILLGILFLTIVEGEENNV